MVAAWASLVNVYPKNPTAIFGEVKFEWLIFSIFLIILIGLRTEVGGDWLTYYLYVENITDYDYVDFLNLKNHDFAYALINKISNSIGLGIYGVNTICGLIFTLTLVSFARFFRYPWIVILTAIPYLVIVVSMGYTRQSVAIGLLMYALVKLNEGSIRKFLLYLIIGALFHKTVLIFIVLPLIAPSNKNKIKYIGIMLTIAFLGAGILYEQYSWLMSNYVEIDYYSSEGGLIRVLMNLPAVFLYLIFYKKWNSHYSDGWIWTIFSCLSLIFVGLVSFASTAVDRMALYTIPLQLTVYGRLPELFYGKIKTQVVIAILIIYLFLIQYVWLNYAHHASMWVPYKFL
jgi:hypothetical protein